MNVILDHAGTITFVTGAPSVAEAVLAADQNARLQSVNVGYYVSEDFANDEDGDAYAESVAYPVTTIPFAELESYDRSGCQYDECHALSFGPNYRSEEYCDDHAGPVTEEYGDVTVIWEGAVSENQWGLTKRSEVEKIVDDVREAIRSGDVPDVTCGGAQVAVSYHTHEFETREELDSFDGDCQCESYSTEYDSLKETPEGLEVIDRDEHAETIAVYGPTDEKFVITNVAGEDESRDRYSVTVDGEFFTDQLSAPNMPGPSWSADPLGSAADAAASFYAAREDAI